MRERLLLLLVTLVTLIAGARRTAPPDNGETLPLQFANNSFGIGSLHTTVNWFGDVTNNGSTFYIGIWTLTVTNEFAGEIAREFSIFTINQGQTFSQFSIGPVSLALPSNEWQGETVLLLEWETNEDGVIGRHEERLQGPII